MLSLSLLFVLFTNDIFAVAWGMSTRCCFFAVVVALVCLFVAWLAGWMLLFLFKNLNLNISLFVSQLLILVVMFFFVVIALLLVDDNC